MREVDCPQCGGPTHYEKDVDHDWGSCEVFECNVCGKSIHVELTAS